jgi:hypothetical protein
LVEIPDTQPMAAAISQEIEMTTAKKVATERPGVISVIVETIARKTGATVEKLVAVLVKKFPDRDADGMRATRRTQVSRYATSKDRDEKRGLVYFKRR